MHLPELYDRIPAVWPCEDVTTWTARLQGICGHFNPRPVSGSRMVTGSARVEEVGGLELAQVANDLDTIRRDPGDIRVDQGSNLFLLVQLEGSCGIEQTGRQERLDPGDCVLVDAAYPSVFHFGGRFSNHLSLHLPRPLVLAGTTGRLATARKIGSDDPLSTMLAALIAKLMQTKHGDSRAPQWRELLFSAVRQVFALDDSSLPPPPPEQAPARIDLVRQLIARHLSDPDLSPPWLAARSGVSLRRLQEEVSAAGLTLTTMIRNARLDQARQLLTRQTRRQATIADIAYAVGFNDISYFNRSFRQLFGCAPSDLQA